MAGHPKASQGEIEEACQFRREGLTISQIAKIMGRSVQWVHEKTSREPTNVQ